MQICVGSGVPGNGCAASHLPHAQSPAATFFSPTIFPSVVSAAWVVNVAFVVSSVAGLYGTGFALTSIGCELTPLAFTMRPMTRPLTGEPSGFLAIGTITQSLSGPGAVRPELSPCQPVLNPISP